MTTMTRVQQLEKYERGINAVVRKLNTLNQFGPCHSELGKEIAEIVRDETGIESEILVTEREDVYEKLQTAKDQYLRLQSEYERLLGPSTLADVNAAREAT